MNPPPLTAARSKLRSTFVAGLAWLLMVAGVIGLPFSFLFIIAVPGMSYATQNSDPVFCTIAVLGPAMLLVVGFGLLKRRWWARSAAIVLLALAVAGSTRDLIKAPRPTTTYTTPSGVKTTVTGSGPNVTALPIILAGVVLTLKLLSRGVREEFPARKPTVFPHDSAAQRSSWASKPGSALPTAGNTAMRATKGKAALSVAIAVMFSISAFMAWTVTTHVSNGETRLPSKRSSLQRTVLREQEPGSFWAAVSLYALIGLGSGGLALWGCREAWRLRSETLLCPKCE